MNRLRRLLVVLLVASTALFAIGAVSERSSAEPAGTHVSEPATGEEGSAGHEAAERAGTDSPAGDGEAVLGIDVESTPLVVLAVVFGLGLAALVATRLGETAAFLAAIAVVAIIWAALDVREVVHQLDESRGGVAAIAMAVAVLHLAVALIAGRLTLRAGAGSRARPGTMPA